jgi:dihydroxyacetone kinase-like protein
MSVTQADILHWLELSVQVFHENSTLLTQLDAAIGDADHGINMDRGFQSVATKLPAIENADISTILKTVGSTLISTVGGASGPLYGTAFLRASTATADKQTLEASDVIAMFEASLVGIKARGKAQTGEKTMLDALTPAIEAAQQAQAQHASLLQVVQSLADGAKSGMESTIPMQATKGRASYLGERSIGHQDPGATSCWLLLQALADTLAKK